MVSADKNGTTLFGNVAMTNSVGFDQAVNSGGSFASTLSQLPAHAEFDWISFSVGVALGPNDDPTQVSYTILVDGQAVPTQAVPYNDNTGVLMNAPMVAHTSDSATISVVITGPSSSDTFEVHGENVEAAQDAWIVPVQAESFRDQQQPAILDLVRGDDTGTPQAPSQAQDIYFGIASSDGVQPGLMQSDGSIVPADPNASTYADFGVTLAGQSGGVTYDPNSGLFKATIPGGQSSVRVDFVPTNLPGDLSVYAKTYTVSISQSPTDPNTQLGFDFNAPATNPTTGAATQPFAEVKQHGLVVQNASSTLDYDELTGLIQQLDDPSYQVRQSARTQLQQWLTLPTGDDYNDILAELAATGQDSPEARIFLQQLLSQYFPWGNSIQLADNANRVHLLLPPSLAGDIGPDTFFYVLFDVTGMNGSFDVPGDKTNDTTTALNSGSIPDVILTPTRAGGIMFTVNIQERRIVNGQTQDVGSLVTENIEFVAVNTN